MNELDALKQQYRQEMKPKAVIIHNLLQSILHDLGSKQNPKWKELEAIAHKFAGSSGTYGFGAISRVLSHLELALISGELQKLKKNRAARYLHAWQDAFDACVREAVSAGEGAAAMKKEWIRDIDHDLHELDHLLHAREVA